MKIPTGQLDTRRSGIGRLLDTCSQAPVADGDTALPELIPTFEQLLDVMARIEADSGSARQSDGGDITEIGEYAQQLAIRLAVVVDTLALKEQREAAD
jgi:hypothetical protein